MPSETQRGRGDAERQTRLHGSCVMVELGSGDRVTPAYYHLTGVR